MEKKSSKLLNFVIFLVAVSICAMGAFMYLKNKENKEDKKENEISEKEEIKNEVIPEIEEQEVKKIVNNYFKIKNPGIISEIKKYGLTDILKLKIALLNTDYTNDYICSDLFEVSGIYNAYFRLTADERGSWGCMDVEKINAYEYEKVNKKYQELFGSETSAIKNSYDGVPTFEYSSDKNVYAILNPRFSPVYEELYIYDIDSYVQEDKKLDVTISYITYTNDYEGKNLVYKIKLNDESDSMLAKSVEEVAKYYANNKNDAYKLKLKYIYENDHYILNDIEK